MSRIPFRALLVLLAVALVGLALGPDQGVNAQVKEAVKDKVAPVPVRVPVLKVDKAMEVKGGAPKEKDPTEFSDAISLPKDNQLKSKIEAAGQYIKVEDYVVATKTLQKLVELPEDKFAQLPRKGVDGKESLVWTSVRAEANRMIANLPPKGLEFYKMSYGPEANKLLKEARETSNVGLLAQVMRVYLHTDAGGEATNLLGTYHLDRGNFVPAGLCFERLLNRAGADKLSPVTLFKAAYAFHQSGDKANETQAWRLLNARTRELKFGEDTKSISDLQEYVAQLRRAHADRSVNDWSMFGGNESRSAQGMGGTAFMEARWKQPMYRTLETKAFLDQSENFLLRQRNYPLLSAFSPVTATLTRDEKKLPLLLYRSHWGLHAVNMASGRLEWETPSSWSVDRMMKEPGKAAAINQWLSFYVQQNQRPGILFENSTIGTLTTDNTYVFVVEDLAVPPPGFPNGMEWNGGRFNQGYGGQYGSGISEAIAHNRLQAFSLSSGKIVWDLGGKEDTGELKDCYFLGPPLPLVGKLYVLTEKQQELRLACIDPAQRGKVLFTQTLAITKEKMQAEIARRTEAAHLAYGEGVLVCPTNAGAILGVDLLEHSLVWAYAYREPGAPAEESEPQPGVIRRPLRPGMVMPHMMQASNFTSQWKVSAPIIQDGKVIFTAPDAQSIHCLNLRDGSRLWARERQPDDLYLAGVFNGKVVIVGKKSCRALSLQNGEPLWTLETGQPSGQGIASDNVYYLPLRGTTQAADHPEICAINLDKGAFVGHARSRKKEVPGNLLFYEGDVISQTPVEVAVFPQLKIKLAQIDRRISENPNDPIGLTERGELSLDDGNLDGAIKDLSAALKNNPPADTRAKARTKLYETLTELFQAAIKDNNFARAEPYLAEYEQLCKLDTEGGNDAERTDRQNEERRRHTNFLCLVAKGRESQRRLVEAFEKYQEFGTVAGGTGEMISVVDEPGVKAAPDVWSQGRIAAMVASATPAERQPLEERITAQWQQLKNTDDLDKLRRFVAVFGSLFTVGKEARLQLAERLMAESDPGSLIDAERHLALLRGPGESPELAARAVECLARLNTRKGLLEDAAYFYRLLGRDYPKVVVRDGKTGADLFNELATDKRLLAYLDDPAPLGAAGKIKVVEERGGFAVQNQVYQFDHIGEPLPFFRNHRLALRYDTHTLLLLDHDNPEPRWSPTLTRTMFQNLVFGNGQPNQVHFPYQTLGHLVVLPVSHRVFGIDPVHKKILWEKDLHAGLSLGSQPGVHNIPGWNTMTVDPRDGSLLVLYPDGFSQRLGQASILGGNGICLQTRDALVAIDPVNGHTLWTRSDVTSRSYIFSDAQNIYVVDMASDVSRATHTRAFRAYDGVSVPVPDFTGPFDKRLRLYGRNILLSETGANNAVTLRLYDVLTGKDLWKETFPANSTALKTEDPDLAGMVEPDGKVRVFNLATGKPVLSARVDDPKHVEKMLSIHLVGDGRDYYLLCNGPADPNVLPFGNAMTNLMGGASLRAIPVNGYVYCFDAATGKRRWYNEVTNQMLVLNQFQDMPLLLFTARYQQWHGVGAGRIVNQVFTARSIDKRTGKLIYKNDTLPPNMFFHALNFDARAGKIEFIGYQLKITFLLNTEDAARADGPARDTPVP